MPSSVRPPPGDDRRANDPPSTPRRVGRYALFDSMATGGTASVHLGKLIGAAGFARVVCIKRLHPHLAKEAEFVRMLLDEARIASRIRHPNVVSILDVVSDEGEVFVVMEYVAGQSLGRLFRAACERGERVPLPVAVAIVRDLLQGLHAAHETRDEHDELLGVVHRDVSPQNTIVGSDGVARVLDFGVAKARGRISATTEEGRLKGKLSYMAPEQLRAESVDRRSDIYAAAIVLWELVTAERLFSGETEALTFERALLADVDPPSSRVSGLPKGFDDVVLRALERDPAQRYATAREMVEALDVLVEPASSSEVSVWVAAIAGDTLARQGTIVRNVERAGLETLVSPGRGASRRWRGGLTAAIAALAGIGIGVIGSTRGTSSVRTASADPVPRMVVPEQSLAPQPSAEQPRADQPPSAPAKLAELAPSTAISTASASQETRRQPSPRPRRSVAPKSAPSVARPDACNPPFIRDADGVKVWKPACVLK